MRTRLARSCLSEPHGTAKSFSCWGLAPVPLPAPMSQVMCTLSLCRPGEAQQLPTCPVGLEGIPDVAVEVVVPCEKEASALGEGDGGDPADDVVMGVRHELLVRTEVEQPAGGVV